MKSFFSSTFFTANRRRLQELAGSDLPIVISSNGLLQRGADGAYAFAQDANFWYLTGMNDPDTILVIDASTEYVILPELSDYQKTFDGSTQAAALEKRSGIETIYTGRTGWRRLTNRLKKTGKAATVSPPASYVDIFGMYTNPSRATVASRLKAALPGLTLTDISHHLVNMRMIKQPPELRAIQAAIDITADSLQDAFKSAKLEKYAFEYELEAEIGYGFRRRGAAGHAFEPIVAGGKKACTLHNVSNDAKLTRGELIVADVGAEVEHYAADITRTVAISSPTARQQAVYDAVLDAQRFAFGLLKPGMDFGDYREQTDRFIGEKLRELGLIKRVTDANTRRYYPHSISHFLGLNVHDSGDYRQPLTAGAVLTVEPGIYIPEEGIGVRIEDDVLITASGIKILSDKLPRNLG